MKRGVFNGGCQAVIEIMHRTNWSSTNTGPDEEK